MSPARTRRPARPAFTMVELLVVIAIIAVLVALTLAAVQKVRTSAVTFQANTDLKDMQHGLKAAMIKYNNAKSLPSRLVLFNNVNRYTTNPPTGETPFDTMLRNRSADTLRKMFGPRLLQKGSYVSWDGASAPTDSMTILEGQQCLVFYLGGVQSSAASGSTTAQKCSGFSTAPLNPMDTTVAARIGPFFEFKSARLTPANAGGFGSNAFFVYLDPYNNPADLTAARPYAYFSSTNATNTYNPYFAFGTPAASQLSDCASLGIWPYVDTVAGQFLNPDSFQIISAGADGLYGVGGGPPPFSSSVYNPGTGSDDPATRDNLANFSRSTLANPVSN